MKNNINQNQLNKKRILSGITPSGDSLHIGNYFGAVKPQIALQDDENYETYYFIADVHALTTIKDKRLLEQNIRGVVLAYLSLGLDPEKCVFFRQSHLSEHSELAVVLANYISYGQMQRMHAFKDKLQKGADVKSINMGLFNYPILMAADILLYKPFGVPVGEDQKQHVELARDIAENFNKAHGVEIFVLPKPLISGETGRIMGTDGKRKMSKSLGNTIGIFDDLADVGKAVAKIPTDSGRGRIEEMPSGVKTLLEYVELFEGVEKRQSYEEVYGGEGIRYGDLKKELSRAIFDKFEFAQDKKRELEAKPEYIDQILREGAERARKIAAQTLVEVKEVVGLN